MSASLKGTIIGGSHNRILIRQKAGEQIELGEMLVAEDKHASGKILLQAYDLLYGSQLSQHSLEFVSGLRLEQESNLKFIDRDLRNYTLVIAKNLIALDKNMISKSLPSFFSDVRSLAEHDLEFLTTPKNPLFVGKLRSGSKVLNADIFLEGDKVLAEHILITASTGKGKSNLTSCILWSCVDKDYCALLVLDPHDEYYGRNKSGLKDHRLRDKVIYYSKSPMPGGRTLKLNIKTIKPSHFNGVVNWTDAQYEALVAYHRKFRHDWVEAILKETPLQGFQDVTIAVIKRRLCNILDINVVNKSLHELNTPELNTIGVDAPGYSGSAPVTIVSNGIFDMNAGSSTVIDICNELERSRTVIIDTSNISSSVEILLGSLVSTELLNRYKKYKSEGTLSEKPVVSIVLEEAPRVLGKEVLEKGQNIFSTIAREGRKFKIGLTAITQLPSLIPRTILANMNTKIIMGMEMGVERKSIIESASQDLSDDDKNIASLDKGEAIVTSNFVRFATPIKIPFFDDIIAESKRGYGNRGYDNTGNGAIGAGTGGGQASKQTIIKQNFIGVGME
jgi:DNA helicase HerA-like ATPase